MATHTPGPWVIHRPRLVICIRNTAGLYVVDQGVCELDDARLIAAAPDLLAALQALVAAVDDDDTDGSVIRYAAALARALEVIEQAEGEA